MANDSIFEGLDPDTAALLGAARATSPSEPRVGLFAAMSAVAVAGPLPVPSTPRRKLMLGKILTAKALGIAGALALTGGVAGAATGTLGPVQDPVAGVVDNVGIHIPKTNHGADVSDAARDKDGDTEGENHGSRVSETARQNHGHEDDATTTDGDDAGDDAGDDSGSGNNGHGNANGHSKDKSHDSDDDSADDSTTTVDDDDDDAASHDSDSDSEHSGDRGGEAKSGHGGHDSDD